uniref:Uncharacterized LOC111239487 n=1 Tax=Seriola dumerili TaxID=41447 RepID=A0A3B4VND8_SERDU
MEVRTNRRGATERFLLGQHLKLNDLKLEARSRSLEIPQYFFRKLPPYPRPELQVSHLKHDTDRGGLLGIKRDGGFRGADRQQWWSLAVKPEDISAAETRLLEETYPDRTEEQAQTQQSFLGRFATSPAFLETSRLGSYRFTFPVEEVLEAYSQQFCSGAPPILRVFETVLYKQEVMYVVLVHSPANQEFQELPLLSDDPTVCVYKDGRFIWSCQAMCETHRCELVQTPGRNQVEVREHFGSDVQFYVWDHVAVALHMDEGQVLKFDDDRLRESLTFCDQGEGSYHPNFDRLEVAKEVVCERLWPSYPAPLEKERSLQESLAALSLCSKVSKQPKLCHTSPSFPLSPLLIGDSIVRNVRLGGGNSVSFPEATVLEIKDKLPDVIRFHPEADTVIIHAGFNDICKEESEVLKLHFLRLFDSVKQFHLSVFISGPTPTCGRGMGQFSRLLALNTWLSSVCDTHGLGFIDNFNVFWLRRHLFLADGFHLNNAGRRSLANNILYNIQHAYIPPPTPPLTPPPTNQSLLF